MKSESTSLFADYSSADAINEKIRIVHKSVTLFSMIGMMDSANQAKTYENNLASNSDVGRKEFEESLLIAINFLK
ncbi:hypothetical protein [Flavobacterium sp.]|uniref:hypothetical protein n=1 Tax=Flavobacterium sp. TaxID=239 RepID=UPI002610267B|nr:hypothetical protein [Flavobacterium sp.]